MVEDDDDEDEDDDEDDKEEDDVEGKCSLFSRIFCPLPHSISAIDVFVEFLSVANLCRLLFPVN